MHDHRCKKRVVNGRETYMVICLGRLEVNEFANRCVGHVDEVNCEGR